MVGPALMNLCNIAASLHASNPRLSVNFPLDTACALT